MTRSWIISAELAALVATAILAPAVQAKGGTRIVLKASKAYPSADGKAKFQTAGQRELEIEVEHVRRLAGKRVNFFVGSTKLGSARINGLGAAQIKRRGSSFPTVQSGTVIKVKTTRGATVVSGRF